MTLADTGEVSVKKARMFASINGQPLESPVSAKLVSSDPPPAGQSYRLFESSLGSIRAPVDVPMSGDLNSKDFWMWGNLRKVPDHSDWILDRNSHGVSEIFQDKKKDRCVSHIFG